MSGPDMRVMIASAVANGLRRYMPDVTVDQGATTSDCPMLTLTLPTTGDVYNLTITRARKRKS